MCRSTPSTTLPLPNAKTYYEGAEIGEEVDPSRMYQIKGELDSSGISQPPQCCIQSVF